jgi:tetratricopeptide (TPR) repeat protein
MTPIFDYSQTAESLNGKGCALCEQDQFDAALSNFNQAIAIAPDYCTAWNNKGNALCGLGRYADALAAYDKAVALNPSYHQAWFNRGKLFVDMGAYGNALESYDRAIALEAAPHYLHARADIWLKGKLFSDSRTV